MAIVINKEYYLPTECCSIMDLIIGKIPKEAFSSDLKVEVAKGGVFPTKVR